MIPVLNPKVEFLPPSILPDNWLYGLKTAIENLQTVFITNDTKKTKFQLKLAEERLAEIKAMLDKEDQENAAKAQELHDKEVDNAKKNCRQAKLLTIIVFDCLTMSIN